MSEERLAHISGCLDAPNVVTSGLAEAFANELLAEVKTSRALLAEMARCRNNAMAYAERGHVPIELDNEIDIDGEVLAGRIEGELLGPGWDWEDDRTPGLLARTAVAVIRPHLARLTDQTQKARAQLAEHPDEWGVALTEGNTSTTSAGEQKKAAQRSVATDPDRRRLMHRRAASQWREAGADHDA